MSVSLLLVPIALPVWVVLRVSMGKEGFDNWIESTEIKLPTNFKDRNELVITVKKAGYDAKEFGDSIKTHVNGKNEFFFWEKIDGVWTAVFSKYDSHQMVTSFISTLEASAGRKIIYSSIEDIKEEYEKPRTINEIPPLPKMDKQVFPTNFISKDILLKTLEEYGVNTIELENEDIQCNIENHILIFHKEGTANYNLEIKGASSLKSIYQHLTVIDEEYKQNVQEYTYKRVVEKLKESDMSIENEEVMEDNSILLTVNIER